MAPRKRIHIDRQEQDSPKMEHEEHVEDVPPLSAQNIDEYDSLNREQIDTMTPGYGFVPTGEEPTIMDFLKKKNVSNLSLPLINRIRDINIYNYHPQQFTTGKYPNGKKIAQSTGNGFWRASGSDDDVRDDKGIKISTKKTLIYYEGKVAEKKDIKTDWIMHEDRNEVNNVSPVVKKVANDIKLDEWDLCEIYKKTSKDDGEAQQVENNRMIVPAANNQQLPSMNPNGDNQGRDNPNFCSTTSLFMPNVQVSNPNTNQGSYDEDFDTSDNLNGHDDEVLDNILSSHLSDYEPGFHCWQSGFVYTLNVSIPEPLQIFPPQAMGMIRDSLPMQNLQNLNSAEVCLGRKFMFRIRI